MIKSTLLLSLLFAISQSFAQITYFNSASTPADNGTNTATTTSVTPPGSMTTGDLVVLYAYQRGTSTTISMSELGGQSWTSEVNYNSTSATLTGRLFWCRFNGTWSADPSVLFSTGTNTNVVMHVFRPSVSSNLWALETNITYGFSVNDLRSQGGASSFWSNPSGDYTINSNVSTITLVIFNTDDDNTWDSSVGTGWSDLGTTQYRNTSGSDVSSAYSYKVASGAANINAIPRNSRTQATLGADPGIWGNYTWYEYSATLPHRVTLIN